MNNPFIIAEIGSNWRKYDEDKQNWACIQKQIELAKEYGADAVKFQLFTAEELYGPKVSQTRFAKDFDRFALPKEWVPTIAAMCEDFELEFMCSAFSVKGYEFVDKYVKRHKIASPEATHLEIVNWLMAQPKQVLYSDGCSSKMDFGRFSDVRLTCVSKYPATVFDYDLSLKGGDNWGISDHTFTNDLALMARSRGANYYEKHTDFCYFEGSDTPDKVVSIDGDNFAKYVKAIREYDPEQTYKLKQKCGKSYARVETQDGWFRPIPEKADLGLAFPNIVGGKL